MLPCDEFYWSRGTSYLSAADCCAASLSIIEPRSLALHEWLDECKRGDVAVALRLAFTCAACGGRR